MNLQQQNKINILWEGILKGLVLSLVKQFGTSALEWLKGKLDELLESGEADEAVNLVGPEGGLYPNCNQGYYADSTTKTCKKDFGE